MTRRRTLAVSLCLCACRSPRSEAITDATSAPVTAVEASAPDPTDAVRQAVTRWNDAHNAHDGDALATLYAPHVSFYGRELTSARCVAQKRAAFKAQPDYAQTLRDIVVKPSSAGATIVRFVKTSKMRGTSTDYPSYLIVQRDLRISDESDDVTDRNLRAKATQAPKASPTAKTCEEAIGAINGWMEEHYPAYTKYPGAFGMDNSALTGQPVNPGDTEYCNTVRQMIVDDPATGDAHSTRLYTMCIDFATGRTTGNGVLVWDPDSGSDDTVLDVGPARRADVVRLCRTN